MTPSHPLVPCQCLISATLTAWLPSGCVSTCRLKCCLGMTQKKGKARLMLAQKVGLVLDLAGVDQFEEFRLVFC